MSYEKLKPLISKLGSTLSPKEFQEVVNIVFHNHEAKEYDELHADMRDNLFEQINLVTLDLFDFTTVKSNKLKLLDVGCGTGLSTHLLLQSNIGKYINEIVLLDTSQEMLKQADKKACLWKKDYNLIEGDISKIQDDKFDVILVCSVLHHIPDLKAFLGIIDSCLKPNGFLIHLQDPNNDFKKDPIYLNRLSSIQDFKGVNNKATSNCKFTLKSMKKRIKRWIGRKDYIDMTNDELLKRGVIKKRMNADEIWSVTDIHIESDLNQETNGISFDFLSKQLINYKLISRRTYGFFGILKNELPMKFRRLEELYINQGELNGRNLACVWKKNN